MKLPQGHQIEIGFNNGTAGRYDSIENAEYAIAAAAAGNPHQSPGVPETIYIIDAAGEQVGERLYADFTARLWSTQADRAKNGGLKLVLMNLGNTLVTEHGFDPANTRPIELLPIQRTTTLVAAFTEFVNNHPEAQQVLKEMGIAWPVVERPSHGRH